jgi:hypothetical protein
MESSMFLIWAGESSSSNIAMSILFFETKSAISSIFPEPTNVFEFVISYRDDHESALKSRFVNQTLAKKLLTTNMPEVEIITCNNINTIKKKSSKFRKMLRGESIGGLG